MNITYLSNLSVRCPWRRAKISHRIRHQMERVRISQFSPVRVSARQQMLSGQRTAASGCRISSGGGSGLSLNPETCAARPRFWTRITPRRRYVCRPCRSRRRPALDRRSGDVRQVMRRQQWTATGAPTGKPCLWSLRIALASASELSVLWTTVVKLDEVRRLTSSRGGEDMLLGI